jgi:hypothetical protein
MSAKKKQPPPVSRNVSVEIDENNVTSGPYATLSRDGQIKPLVDQQIHHRLFAETYPCLRCANSSPIQMLLPN